MHSAAHIAPYSIVEENSAQVYQKRAQILKKQHFQKKIT